MPTPTCPDAPPEFYRSGQYGPQDSWAYVMRQLMSGATRLIGEALAPWDLPSVQWMPLMRLAMGQRCTVVALARDLGVDAATMTRSTDKLVARGWVERQRSCTDRRLVELHITPQGQQVAQQLKPVLTQALNAHLTGFSEAEWLQLMGFLHRMQANAQRLAPITPPCLAPDTQALDEATNSSSIPLKPISKKRQSPDTG
ncbi:hypothetical protein CCO03_05255 [Comamonas serinivorans]|uniref:HTH marR-type domain-containing protein n=1 Tax=Comamonas serinivorans TaxID=1082851 RepID=A0A1Y0ELH7_9BURK|nr:MarR family transcriptional regulator [Comamonas serinivorans]ARU04162.1 hypothetical protein CCO03_05255 [Comamonas serinivorans]